MWSAKGAPATLVGVASVATAGAAAGEASYRVRPTARLYKTGARRAGRGALSHGALCAVALSAAAPPAARRVRGGRAGRERDRALTARGAGAQAAARMRPNTPPGAARRLPALGKREPWHVLGDAALSLLFFRVLLRGEFRRVAPSDLTKPGAFAKEWVPTTGEQ
jgi:hypothetical protein